MIAEGTPAALAPRRAFEGNRPSNVMPLDRLTPAAALGSWARSTSTMSSVIWGVDAFDRWDVELGKVLAQRFVTS